MLLKQFMSQPLQEALVDYFANGQVPWAYVLLEELVLKKILDAFQTSLGIDSTKWLHKELATPKSFARWTGRPLGIVGGLGQKPTTFGPFGLASRTPIKGLWLCGDSIYPGEGTAGVSQSALMACRQLMSENGRELTLTI